jgi:hypothetical protein
LQPYRLFRWDEIALEKVTEMVSRKFVSGERETIAQIYLKRGALVPQHTHDSEQMTYVLQGALKLLGSCGKVPAKSMLSLRRSAPILMFTYIQAPLSSGYSKLPPFNTPITRRTDSSALSCTWPM